VSSQLLAADIEVVEQDAHVARDERTHMHMTMEDRLDPATRDKLWKLLGRS